MTSPIKTPSKRLFVGSIPYRFTEGQLLELFVPFGRVISLKIMHTPWGKSRGLGFVEYDTLDSAIEAKTKMHNYLLGDLSIIVDYAQEDPAKTPEGLARHDEAVARHPQKFKKYEPKIISKASIPRTRPVRPALTPANFEHQRQSVFDSRTHHAGIGKKFALRSRQKAK
ncbi:MAG: RNA-binding protein [Candidatus Shapirobacteria bacterium]|nr:RNA-binding protein [Candidatus Shapirobacteria bacterium]